jgi:hypothetical protein
VDDESNILYITLKEPFYSAGKKFGWDGNTVGLGVAKDIIKYAKEHNLMLAVKVGNGNWYYTTPIKWLSFVAKYNSVWKTKEGKEIYLVRWSELQRLYS